MHSRRNFIKQSLAVTLGFSGLSQFIGCQTAKRANPLMKANEWLELPAGFQASIISRWGDKMDDGFFVPARADGMATFQQGDRVVMIRNHENNPDDGAEGPFGKDNALLKKLERQFIYDYGYGKTPGLGGTTTLIFNERKQQVERQFLSLIGTYRNCAGGPTPWNSWISCEESTVLRGNLAEVNHGFNFEIPASSRRVIQPVPLKEMGRFNHEAVCVHPASGIVYQTEDRGDGLIYRYLPSKKGKLHEGGMLQALVIKGTPRFDTRNWAESTLSVNEPMDVEWITLAHVDAPEDDLRLRGAEAGAAVFARGEGMWFGNNEVYFACTNGGKRKAGQVFKYIPSRFEGSSGEIQEPGKLILFAEPNDTDILKFCDNLTVSPWGDVVFVEDSADAHLRGITPAGKIYTIGKNIGSRSEMAGICFSPTGKTMFVNVQEQGLTFAITGPWENLRSLS